MTAFTESKPPQTQFRATKSKNGEVSTPFPITEAEELAAKLEPEQYAAVQSYRHVLIEAVLHEKIIVDEMTIAFGKDWDSYGEIVFLLYVTAEAQAAMDFWDKLGEAQEKWITTQPKALEDFLYEYLVTLVRRKHTHV